MKKTIFSIMLFGVLIFFAIFAGVYLTKLNNMPKSLIKVDYLSNQTTQEYIFLINHKGIIISSKSKNKDYNGYNITEAIKDFCFQKTERNMQNFQIIISFFCDNVDYAEMYKNVFLQKIFKINEKNSVKIDYFFNIFTNLSNQQQKYLWICDKLKISKNQLDNKTETEILNLIDQTIKQ